MGGRRGEIKGQCPSNISLITFYFFYLKNVVLVTELKRDKYKTGVRVG
jgi:hypothetical protein